MTLTNNIREEKLADIRLAQALNEGWEVLDISVTSAVVAPGRVQIWRVVTLRRDVEEPPEEESAATVEIPMFRYFTDPKGPEDDEEKKAPQEPPLPPPLRKIHVGTIVEEPVTVGRKPLDEVSYAEALFSGKYTAEEIIEIGNREALEAGLRRARAMQQRWGKREWTSLVNRLPIPTE